MRKDRTDISIIKVDTKLSLLTEIMMVSRKYKRIKKLLELFVANTRQQYKSSRTALPMKNLV